MIIIGAGISGIGASKGLSEAGIEHIVLESRDRLGGRICSQKLAGGKVELGASFISQNQLGKDSHLNEFIKTEKFKLSKVSPHCEYYYEGRGHLEE